MEHEQINLAGSGFEPGALPGLASNPEFNLYTVGGGISYDLDLFGGTRRELEQVSAQAESQRYQTEAAHLTSSEEHTSELQSLMRNSYAVFCLTKKQNNKQ